jgi:hypothetical protein
VMILIPFCICQKAPCMALYPSWVQPLKAWSIPPSCQNIENIRAATCHARATNIGKISCPVEMHYDLHVIYLPI